MRKREGLPVAVSSPQFGRAFESLESRVMLSVSVYDPVNVPVNTPTTTNLTDVKNGPMANAGTDLINLYREYRRAPDPANFTSSLSNFLTIKGDKVLVTVRGRSGINSLVSTLQSYGSQIVGSSAQYGTINAFVPIGQVRGLAATSSVVSVMPAYRPITWQQGTANNQAVETLLADRARSIYGLSGAGVKIGVLSDSVNLVGNGVAGSIATGDLPAGGVEIIQDFDPSLLPTDEGRAILELIHDIAPNAELAFATAAFSQQSFADNILALRDAGCDIIVDDVGYFAEPFFQPGVIDQSIKEYVEGGGIYVSSAGNADDDGYDAPTRWIPVGSGRIMDFDAGPGIDTRMRVSTLGGLAVLQWDSPYNGIVGSVTADLDIYVYDALRPDRLVASATTNNLLMGVPVEILTMPFGTYDIEIRISEFTPGQPLPTRFKLGGPFGLLGTEYSDGVRGGIWGHSGGLNTISVGAVPFYNTPPFGSPGTISNEDFSSMGPVTHLFDYDGNRLPEPITINKPDVSGIDGGNTSFFIGLPATPLPGEADILQDPDNLPNFFGTSASAPNVAAVIALMLEAAPGATQEQIVNALQATATPLNGAPVGAYDPQAGFGLVNALAAVEQFVDGPGLTIVSVHPDPGYTPINRIKFAFTQQVSGFSVSDVTLRRDGGPNLLTGDNRPRTNDGGRTWWLKNLDNITAEPGVYTVELNDADTPITNPVGLELTGAGGLMTQFQILPTPAFPATPVGLKAQVLSSTTVRLRWIDNAVSENAYLVQRAENAGFTVALETYTIGADRTTYLDQDLPTGGRPVFYRVIAVNGLGEASNPSNVVGITSLSPGEIIIDNSFTSDVTINGSWSTVSAGSNFIGDSYLISNSGADNVQFEPNIRYDGYYYVYARWTRGSDRATNVPIDIYANGRRRIVTVNQRTDGGNGWVLLGKVFFRRGSGNLVQFRTDGTNGRVVVDALRFLPAVSNV